MSRFVSLLPALLLVALMGVGPSFASGASSPSPTASDPEPQTPEEQAQEHYNYGLASRDQASKIEKKLAAGEVPEAKQAKLESKIRTSYERAIQEYLAATKIKPDFHQAYSSLGYAYRKTGRFEEALKAYDTSLTLVPDYAEAIEYRAEAYLGLNRIEPAKKAFDHLHGKDEPRAAELLQAMRSWIEHRRKVPAGIDPETLNDLERWISERSGMVGHAAAPGSLESSSW